MRLAALLVLACAGCGAAIAPAADGGDAGPGPTSDAQTSDAGDASAEASDAACGKGCVPTADGSVIFWDSCADAEAVACTVLCQEGDASACMH